MTSGTTFPLAATSGPQLMLLSCRVPKARASKQPLTPSVLGKSRLNAWKNSLVDQRTNSACEGFRLEGIEGPPEGLEERMRQVGLGRVARGEVSG